MAGTIEFRFGTWNSSGGTFRAMAGGVMQHLLEDESSARVRAVLREAIDSKLFYLDCRDFDHSMRAAFQSALCRYLADVKTQGAAAFPAPDLFAGFVEQIDELATMIERESRI